MIKNNKIGIVVDEDFASKNVPPYPHPIFLSYENPLRIKTILNFLEEKKLAFKILSFKNKLLRYIPFNELYNYKTRRWKI